MSTTEGLFVYALSVIGIVVLILYPLGLTLENLANLAQSVAVVSVVLALYEYRSKNERERISTVANQVRMFRLEIIELFEKAVSDVKSVNKTKEIVSIQRIEEFSLKWLIRERQKESRAQNEILLALEKQKGTDFYKKNILQFLNAMEEFSIGVLQNKVYDEPGLLAVKKAFVEGVEIFAHALMLEGPYNPDMFKNIKLLYLLWYKTSHRMTVEQVQAQFESDVDEGLGALFAERKIR